MLLVARYVATPCSNSTSRSKTNWHGRRGLKQEESIVNMHLQDFSYLHPLPFNFSTIFMFSCIAASGQEFPKTKVSTWMLQNINES